MRSPSRFVVAVAIALTVVGLTDAGEPKFKVQPATTEPPAELADAVKKLFGSSSVQLLDASGKQVAEFWFRPQVPVDATAEQIKNGLTYKEVAQTQIMGAVRFDQDWSDYRKQKIKAGVYTFRLGFQPMDGDHQGSSEFQDFLVVTAADKDTSSGLLEAKEMIERSAKSINTGHPGVLMLSPNVKPGAPPAVVSQPRNHVVLNVGADAVTKAGKTGAKLGIGLNIVGHAE